MMPIALGQLSPRVPPASYANIFTISLLTHVLVAVAFAAFVRPSGRWAARSSPSPYRPRATGGTSSGGALGGPARGDK